MNVLMLSAPLPHPKWGASKRNYYLLQALARRHRVSLLTFANKEEAGVAEHLRLLEELAEPVQVIPFQAIHARRWRQFMSVARSRSYLFHLFIQPAMQEALDAMLEGHHYDLVLFENAVVAGYRLAAGVPVVIDQHNIEYEILQRTYERERPSLRKWYNHQQYRLAKQAELERCRRADLLLVTSEREHQVFKRFLPEHPIEVVPNGVDLDLFHNPDTGQEQPHQIIFTGIMDYYPNVKATLFFAQHCWPRIRAAVPDATWLIVGVNPPPTVQRLAHLPGVTVTGWVPDVRPYLASSAVAIVPLEIGSGTRLKILEALAMQKAVVSTSLGCEGLALTPGQHLMVADQPDAFAEAVIAFLKNPARRASFGAAGRALVEATYSWEQCGARLLSALDAHCTQGEQVCR